MKKVLFLIVFLAIALFSCSDGVRNRLVGHTYVLVPVSSIMKMRLGMRMATIEHEYKSNHEVQITTYIGKEATKKESMTYLFDDSVYKLDNERYDISFDRDTAIFSVNGDVLFRLEPLK